MDGVSFSVGRGEVLGFLGPNGAGKSTTMRMIEVQFPEATNSWKLTRASETNDWQLADAKPGEKLAKEQQFENWVYYLPSYSVDEILKTREQLLVERKKETSSKPVK